jgi:threonine dehydrogenase-like Zn-dependent dehydrogenase
MKTIYVDLEIPRVLATRALGTFWPGAYTSPISPLHFVEQPDPPLPGPRYVRVRNRLGAICGTDLHLVKSDGDPRISIAALPVAGRAYLGHEICGQVEEVGTEVRRVRPGDRVAVHHLAHTCQTLEIDPPCRHCAQGEYRRCENQAVREDLPVIGGGWGDQLVIHEALLYGAEEALTDEQVALLEPVAVGLHVVLRSLPQPGDQVMVLGCGSIGLMTVQALRVLVPQAKVTALARYPFQAEVARRLGAHEVYQGADPYEMTAETTGARLYRGSMGSVALLGGFDVVYDCVGLAGTLTTALRCARAGGRVALVGDQFLMLHVDLTPLWYQEIQLVAPLAHDIERWQGEEISTFAFAARLFLADKLTTEGLITHRFPLSRWRDAIRTAMDKRRYQSIKVAFEF